MTDIKNPAAENRRLQLRKWIEQHFGGSQALFIAATNNGEKQINQGELSGLLRDKSFGERRARSLEKQAGMPAGYLDDQSSSPINKVAEINTQTNIAVTTGWPFSKVPLRRILDLKAALGVRKGIEAMHDIDDTLEVAVMKWEQRVAHAKSHAA